MRFLLKVSGADFDTTIFDTQDLSTIRGASSALLYAPAVVFEHLREIFAQAASPDGAATDAHGAIDILYAAASEGMAEVTLDGQTDISTAQSLLERISRQALANAKFGAVLPHMSVLIVAQPLPGDAATNPGYFPETAETALAAARIQQLQTLSINLPDRDPKATDCCPLDRTHPATTEHHLPGQGKTLVSRSVNDRRKFGREGRQKLAELEFSTAPVSQELIERLAKLRFSDSFEEIVTNEHRELKMSLHNKLAIIHLDGNEFGKIYAEAARTPDGARRHSRVLSDLRSKFLTNLLDRICAIEDMYFDPGGERKLRFETLMWGGDESLFVVPGWAALRMIAIVQSALADWKANDRELFHATGVVICDRKSPIRQSKALAESLANSAKKCARDRSLVQIQILEGVEVPDTRIDDFRKKLFGTDAPDCFSFAGGADWEEIMRLLAQTIHPKGLPRSQLMRLLQQAVKQGCFRPSDTNSEAAHGIWREFQELLQRYEMRDGAPFPDDFLADANFGYTARHPLMPLVHLAQFWDYAFPYGQTVKTPLSVVEGEPATTTNGGEG